MNQTEKYRRKAAGETLDGEYLQGFKSSGLFSIVRKPNYACEQGLWVSFGLFSLSTFQSGIARQSNIINWSHIGWILYLLLFQGSGPFTEKITLTKYPIYAEYMKETPLYVPNIFKLLFGKAKPTNEKKDWERQCDYWNPQEIMVKRYYCTSSNKILCLGSLESSIIHLHYY